MDKDKAFRRGLRWLGLAIIAAILSGAGDSVVASLVLFGACVVFSFNAYLYLMWEG